MVKIPQYLSKLPKFAFLELDDILVGVLPLLLGIILKFDSLWIAIFVVGLTIVYMKNKAKASRGFLFHIYYMLGGKFQGFESVHTRKYQE
jgi:type IV conjugative transfer system protein TraL